MAVVPPKNVLTLVNRLQDYTKNNVRVVPPTNNGMGYGPPLLSGTSFVSGSNPVVVQTMSIDLPTNAIIDLETLTLSANLNGYTTLAAGTNLPRSRFAAPTHVQQLIERVDVLIGGVNVSHPDMSDYGAIYTTNVNLGTGYVRQILDGQFGNGYLTANAQPGSSTGVLLGDITSLGAGVSNATTINTAQAAFAMRFHVYGFLGFLQGTYARFLDTSLLPQVTIQIRWAQNNGRCWLDPSTTSWYVSNPTLNFDTIEYAGNAMHQMAAANLEATGQLQIPFQSYAWYQGSLGGAGPRFQVNATVNTNSLDRVAGTLRYVKYDGPYTAGQGSTGSPWPFKTSGNTAGQFVIPAYKFDSNSSTNVSALSSGFSMTSASTDPVGTTTYQFLVGNKSYPTYPANSADAYYLMKNATDSAGLNDNSTGPWMSQREVAVWYQNFFAFPISLTHNTSKGCRSRKNLIAGGNTQGAYVPIQFTVEGASVGPTTNGGQLACIYAEMTSTLIVSPGRTVSVVW